MLFAVDEIAVAMIVSVVVCCINYNNCFDSISLFAVLEIIVAMIVSVVICCSSNNCGYHSSIHILALLLIC